LRGVGGGQRETNQKRGKESRDRKDNPNFHSKKSFRVVTSFRLNADSDRAVKNKISELSKKILLPVTAENWRDQSERAILAWSLVAFRGEDGFWIGPGNFANRDSAESNNKRAN
jgi:hypothetical protein